MEYYNNMLCLRVDWLVDNEVVTSHQYKYLAKSEQINVVRRGCRNTPALVSYESIPERLKPIIIEKLGCHPHEVVKVSQIVAHVEHSSILSAHFDEYRLADGRSLPREVRREYYTNAIILEAIGRMLADKKAFKKSRSIRVVHKWNDIAQGVQELDRTKFPHTLPANERRLKDRYMLYMKEGWTSLIHKNFLNAHAVKVQEGENSDLLLMLISDPRNLDNAQVAKLYNMMAGQMNWRQITANTVANHREKNEHVIYARRRGASEFRNNKTMQVKRSAPTFPLYYWTMDGWNVELLYQQEGKGKTTYYHRPAVVVVLDACLRFPIGFAVGTHETPELIQEALRSAMKYTEYLFGQMYRTNQLQSDHYAIKKMTPFYAGVSDKIAPAQVRNAKAKIIEPYFKDINKKYCQMQRNWSGFGVTAKKENQPNSEFLNKYRKDFPDFGGVCQQVIAMIEAERAEKMEAYMELFRAMPAEHKIPMSYESYLKLFGATTGHKNLLQGSGLKITIGGQKRDYDCFDHDFRRFASTKWEVRFDPEDLSRVLAVNEDESRHFLLEEKYVQPMALIERKPGDYEQLERIRTFNKEFEQNVAARLGEAQINTEMLLEDRRGQIEESTLQKLLLVDSDGQHKNRRNAARKTKETAAAEVFEVVEELYLDLY